MNESQRYQPHYTKSDAILDYMTTMLDFKPQDSIFEPCGGDGVFIDKILNIYPKSDIVVYELNPNAADILRDKYKVNENIRIKETDTLLDDDVILGRCKFDKIIGNPPYGAKVDVAKKNALSRIYNNLYTKESYTLFLYACINCLKENGELCFIIPDTFLSLHRHYNLRKYLLTHCSIREISLFSSSFFPGISFGYANLCIITLVKCSDISKNLSNNIVIRTGFNNVEELGDTYAGRRKLISQEAIYSRPNYAFMFNSSDVIAELVNDERLLRIGDIASCVTGFYSGNDKKYLRPLNDAIKNSKKYRVVDINSIASGELTDEDKVAGIEADRCFVPIVKGGSIKYFKPSIWFMDWSKKAILEFRGSKKCRFQNSSYYFRNGVGIPMIRSSKLTGALLENRLFDQSIVGVFPKDESMVSYLLAFFNSSICTKLIDAINPSTNNSANYIKQIPFIVPTDEIRKEVEQLVETILHRIKNGNDQINDLELRIDNIFDELYLGRQKTDKRNRLKIIDKQPCLFDKYGT